MRLLTLPGVFRPRSDTWMLARALRASGSARARACSTLCTGSGALAVTAAAAAAPSATALDVSRRAVL